jgi:hypothetical protein
MDTYFDDDEKLETLKRLVDEACEKIKSGRITLGEAKKEAALVRMKAEKIIPFEMDKFDLIYGTRFERLIEQYLLPKQKEDTSK